MCSQYTMHLIQIFIDYNITIKFYHNYYSTPNALSKPGFHLATKIWGGSAINEWVYIFSTPSSMGRILGEFLQIISYQKSSSNKNLGWKRDK